MMDDAIDQRLIEEWRALLASTAVPEAREMAAPDRASRITALFELEDSRRLIQELRTSLTAGEERVRATRRWTVRDVVAHLASWARETRVETERLLAGEAFDERIHFEAAGGPVAWNQREIDTRHERTLPELFDELDQEMARLSDVVASTTAEEAERVVVLPRTSGEPPVAWQMPLAKMIVMSSRHLRLHLSRLRQVLPGGRGGT